MRQVLRIVSYIVAGICFLWGALYLIATYLAHTQLEQPIELVGYLAIAFWTGLFFSFGVLIIFFLHRQKYPSIKSPLTATTRQTKQQKNTSLPPRPPQAQEQKKSPTDTESLKHLKVQLTLGEITKEEFERKKKELAK